MVAGSTARAATRNATASRCRIQAANSR